MNAEGKLSAIVVENQPLMLASLSAAVLATKMKVVAEVMKHDDAIAIAKASQPHLILFSVGESGIEDLITLAALRREVPGAVILALVSGQYPSNATLAIAHGAHRVLSKAARTEDLRSAIRALAKAID